MDYMDVSLQTVALLFCLTSPGYFLLSKFIAAETWTSLPPAVRLAYSWTVSSLLISAISALLYFIPQTYAHGIAWLILVASVSSGLVGLKKTFAGNLDKLEVFSLVIFFLILALCALSYPLSPYPSQLSAGYGDPPSYYRVAANIAKQHSPVVDFRIGDYLGEIYLPPIRFPLLVLVGSFFLHIFNSSHIIGLFCTASGALCFYFGLSLLRFPGANQTKTLVLYAILTVFSLCLNQNIFHIGLGALTLPAAFYILVLSHIILFFENTSSLRQMAMGLVAGIAIIASRPEGFLFFVSLVVSCVLLFVTTSIRFAWKRGAIFFAACFLILSLTIGLGVSLSSKISLDRSLALSYVKYDPKDQIFKFAYGNQWWFLNFAFVKESLGEKGDEEYNPNIVREIATHPFSFIMYATMRISELGPENMMALFIFCAIICISRPDPRTYALVTAFVLFFYALSCANLSFSNRQSITVLLPLPFVFSWVVSRLFLKSRTRPFAADPGLTETDLSTNTDLAQAHRLLSSIPFYFALLICTLIVFSRPIYIYVSHIYLTRTVPVNVAYTSAIEALRKIIKPGMTVASTYPQLLGYLLDTPSVGNFLLYERVGKLIAKYSPDLILIDNFRTQNYMFFTNENASVPGYKIAVNNPIAEFLVLEKAN